MPEILEETAQEEQSESPPLARFTDRMSAFGLDASLFISGCWATAFVIVLASRGEVPSPYFYSVWTALWAALFLAYHTYYGADGRLTLGKKLVGIRVFTTEGEVPDLATSFKRSVGYCASSLFLNIGFLWALRGDRRAFHDLIAGTLVVEMEGRSPRARNASVAAAWALGLSMFAAFMVLVVIGPGMVRMTQIAEARTSIKNLAYLQETHRKQTGAYTADLNELLTFSQDARDISADLSYFLLLDSIQLRTDPDGYTIVAAAHDKEGTVLKIAGPLPRP